MIESKKALKRAQKREWAAKNPEKRRAALLKYRLANLDHIRAQAREYAKRKYAENKVGALDRGRQWKAQNPEKNKVITKGWKQRNKGRCCAIQRRREAAKINAVPIWADLLAIRAFYEARPEGHHVDHIYPLQSDWVCGLHVLENLQYLPAVENLRKGNRAEK